MTRGKDMKGHIKPEAESFKRGLGVGDRRYVGRGTPLIDGLDKSTGRGKYSADLHFPDALVGRMLRSPHAHARIKSIDTSEAEAMPGVKAVVTGADSDKPFGVLPIAQQEYPLARDKVRYKGEQVAAVAAVVLRHVHQGYLRSDLYASGDAGGD